MNIGWARASQIHIILQSATPTLIVYTFDGVVSNFELVTPNIVKFLLHNKLRSMTPKNVIPNFFVFALFY
jgi:hypothetical protein